MWKNCKKVMAGTLSACMLVTGVPGAGELGDFAQLCEVAQAATEKNYTGTCGENAKWEFNTNTKTLTISGTGEMEDYSDPDVEEREDIPKWPGWDGMKVEKVIIGDGITKIGEYTFSYIDEIKEVECGNTLKKIGAGAFYRCGALEKITSEADVEEIGYDAFGDCSSLKEASLGNNINTIGRYAFYGCGALKQIGLGKGVQEISNSTFYGCVSLEEITLGDDLKEIGINAFSGCKKLKSIYIGKSLQKIGDEAFEDCIGIEEVKLHPENAYFEMNKNVLTNKENTELYLGFFSSDTTCNVGAAVTKINMSIINNKKLEHFEVSSENPKYYSEDGMLYTKDGSQLLSCPKGKKGTATVSDKAVKMQLDYNEYDEKSVGFCVAPFENCTKLEKIIIGKKIKYLDNAFYECTSLKEVEVDVENDYYSASDGAIFNRDHNKLLYYIIPDEDGTYTVPKDVMYIDEDAFSGGVKTPKNVVLPDKLCDFEIRSYSIPQITLGKNYYNNGDISWLSHGYDGGNVRLKINVSKKNPYYSSKDGILYNKKQTKLLACPSGVTVYKMPNTVKSVGKDAFESYSALKELYVSDAITDTTNWLQGENLQKIHFGKKVKKIRVCDMEQLKSITVSSKNKTYKSKNNALYTKNGKKLVWYPQGKKGTATISNGTTIIGGGSFYWARNIKKISIPKTVKKIEKGAFECLDSEAIFYVPKGKKKFYKKLLTSKTGFEDTMTIKEK